MGTPKQSACVDDGGGEGFVLVTRRRLAPEFKTPSHGVTGIRKSLDKNSSLKTRTHSVTDPIKTKDIPETPSKPSVPGPVPGTLNGSASMSNTAAAGENASPKKSKKKKESKEARLRRREEERFKAIYGPKDSRIQVMSPALFARLQGSTSGHSVTKTVQGNTPTDSLTTTTTENTRVSFPKPQWDKSLNFSSPDMKVEFPELGAKPSRAHKQMAEPSNNLATPSTSAKANSSAASTSNSAEPEPSPSASVTTASSSLFSNGVKTENIVTSTPLTVTTDLSPNSSSPSKLETSRLNKKKPSKAPLIINIEEALLSTKKGETPKRPTQALAKATRKLARINEKMLQPAGNILDSSGIKVMHRGKMREAPRKKKPSKLKRAILLSRQLRKQLAISENQNREQENVEAGLDQENEGSQELSKLTLNLSLEPENSLPDQGNLMNLVEVKQEPSPLSPEAFVEDISEISAESEKKSLEIEVKQEDSDDYESDSDSKPTLAPVILQPDYFHNLVEGTIKQESEPSGDTNSSSTPPESANANLSPEIVETVKSQMHNRKFRKYCNMYMTKELHGLVISLLKQLHHFQDKLYKTDMLKYKLKKRYVHGIREIMNFMSINKVQMIILAPDIESNKNVKGGLDDVVESMLATAKSKNVPVVFSGNRYVLGIPIKIKTPISAIGILDHQGAEDQYRKILDEAAQLRLKYQDEFYKKVQALALTSTSKE